ncbi:MAG: F0F1 ATP synthase subunit A [Treponema sp.]|jgi:F-type H+-transporting ATPase subunit a|nr:F0F1 ATP synthase subunit A [Treponema sp.]
MGIEESLNEFKAVFSIPFPNGVSLSLFGQKISSLEINETVLVSWIVMAILIGASLLLTRKLSRIPKGAQIFLEWAVDFLNGFSKAQFGKRSQVFGPYIGTIFLFILLANLLPAVSPVAIRLFGVEPPFALKPPTRDINLTAALAMMTIIIVLISGLKARGPVGWFKNLFTPIAFMLPFNLLEYIIKPLSLCLRLYGNILGGYIIMSLIENAMPIPLFAPAALSVYFDFFDGMIQAVVFTFLTTLYISEAVGSHE